MSQLYLADKNLSPETECQIDIVAIRILDSGKIEIEHIENAVGN